MDYGHIHFRADNGAEASLYWGKREMPTRAHNYYVTTYWPAGVQGFPNVHDFDDLAEMPRYIYRTQETIESIGFKVVSSTVLVDPP